MSLPELPITVSADQRQVDGDQKERPFGQEGIYETHRGSKRDPKGIVPTGALRYTEGT